MLAISTLRLLSAVFFTAALSLMFSRSSWASRSLLPLATVSAAAGGEAACRSAGGGWLAGAGVCDGLVELSTGSGARSGLSMAELATQPSYQPAS